MTLPIAFQRFDSDGFDADVCLDADMVQGINANLNDLAADRLNSACVFFWEDRRPRLIGQPCKMAFLLPPWPLTPGVDEITLAIGFDHGFQGTTTLYGALLTDFGLSHLQDGQTVSSGSGVAECAIDTTGQEGWIRPVVVAESTFGTTLTIPAGNVDGLNWRWIKLNASSGANLLSNAYVVEWDDSSYDADRLPPDALLIHADYIPTAGEYYQFIWPPYDEEVSSQLSAATPDFVGKQVINLKRSGFVDLRYVEVRETSSRLVSVPQEAYKAGKAPSARAGRELSEVSQRLERVHTTIVAYGSDVDFAAVDPDDATQILRPCGAAVDIHTGASGSWVTIGSFVMGDYPTKSDVPAGTSSTRLTFEARGYVGVISSRTRSRSVKVELRATVTDVDGTGTSKTTSIEPFYLDALPWDRSAGFAAFAYLETFLKGLEHYDRDGLSWHPARGVFPLPQRLGVTLGTWGLVDWALDFEEDASEAAAARRLVQIQARAADESRRGTGYPEFILFPAWSAVERRLPLT